MFIEDFSRKERGHAFCKLSSLLKVIRMNVVLINDLGYESH